MDGETPSYRQRALAVWLQFARWIDHNPWGRLGAEAALTVGMLMLYGISRGFVIGAEDVARQNAMWVVAMERWMGIFAEPSWQAWVLERSVWSTFFDRYYEYVHFPSITIFLAWLYFRHADRYRLVRNTLLITTFFAFLVHWWYPLMPPRMLPSFGFVDTVADGIYADHAMGRFTNQLAAMPSLHFGWSLLAGVGVVKVSQNRFRYVALLHPTITLLAIVVTANHYFLDALFVVPVLYAGYRMASSAQLNDFLDRVMGRKPTALETLRATGTVSLVAGGEPSRRASDRDDPAHR